MNKINLMFLIILLTPTVMAATDISYYFRYGEDIHLKRECFFNGALCGASYSCSATVYDRDNLIVVDKKAMSNNINYYNYTIDVDLTTNLTRLDNGVYRVMMNCSNTTYSGAEIFYFQVTPSQYPYGNDTIFLILVGMSFLLLIIALSSKSYQIGFISGITFIVTGIYTIIYGFANLSTLYTQAAGYTFIGLGIMFMIVSAYEQID